MQFHYTDPEGAVVADMPNGLVFSAAAERPSVRLSMVADLAIASWQGMADLPLALAKLKINVDGAGLLELAPHGKRLHPVYIGALKRDRRLDLVV